MDSFVQDGLHEFVASLRKVKVLIVIISRFNSTKFVVVVVLLPFAPGMVGSVVPVRHCSPHPNISAVPGEQRPVRCRGRPRTRDEEVSPSQSVSCLLRWRYFLLRSTQILCPTSGLMSDPFFKRCFVFGRTSWLENKIKLFSFSVIVGECICESKIFFKDSQAFL